jgi:hypothetical protein
MTDMGRKFLNEHGSSCHTKRRADVSINCMIAKEYENVCGLVLVIQPLAAKGKEPFKRSEYDAHQEKSYYGSGKGVRGVQAVFHKFKTNNKSQDDKAWKDGHLQDRFEQRPLYCAAQRIYPD